MKTLVIFFLAVLPLISTFSSEWQKVRTNSKSDLYLLKTKNTVLNESAYYKDLAISAYIYLPKTEVKRVVIITPTIAGLSPIEKINARFFVKRGYAVIVPLPFKSEIDNNDPDIRNLDQEFLLPAQNADIFLNLLFEKLSLSDDVPVYAMGASQGGFRSLVIAAKTTRVRAAWIVTAGADFASIYADSQVEKILNYKNRSKEKFNFASDDEYEDYVRTNLTNDPKNLCAEIKIPFTQTIATKDDKVPTANQLLLEKSCPNHHVIRLKTGHVQASLSTSFYLKKIAHFFEQY